MTLLDPFGNTALNPLDALPLILRLSLANATHPFAPAPAGCFVCACVAPAELCPTCQQGGLQANGSKVCGVLLLPRNGYDSVEVRPPRRTEARSR